MNYFKVLGLVKEPFSNSPDPEFFFQSRKHVSCLQKLEIAVRMRRGLNVVMGEVGTGEDNAQPAAYPQVFRRRRNRNPPDTRPRFQKPNRVPVSAQ